MFDKVFDFLIEIEGGYCNDPSDPGGETKYGISKRQYPHLDIKNLTKDEAKEIYKKEYWFKFKCNLIKDQNLAAKIFLAVVNINATKVIKYLQEICNLLGANLIVDGVIGPKTINWINSYKHQKAIIAGFEGELYEHYKAQNKPKFLAGWLIRNDTDFV